MSKTPQEMIPMLHPTYVPQEDNIGCENKAWTIFAKLPVTVLHFNSNRLYRGNIGSLITVITTLQLQLQQ